MPLNVTEKIIEAHLVKGRLIPGEEIGLKIDQTLTQDATGTMVYLQFESMGLSSVATELSVSYVDHNTIQDGYETRTIINICKRWRPNTASCFQGPATVSASGPPGTVSAPGKSLLGSDSHTPTCGGVGCWPSAPAGLM